MEIGKTKVGGLIEACRNVLETEYYKETVGWRAWQISAITALSREFESTPIVKLCHVWALISGAYRPVVLSKRFTPFVVELMALGKSNEECHVDVDRWSAPSECHGLVEQSYRRDVTTLLNAYEYTVQSFWDECKRRGLRDKWTYFNLPTFEWE